MKKSKNISIIFLFISLVWSFGCGPTGYKPEIININEESFEFKSDKPIYYQIDNKLYYSKDGKLELNQQPIWDQNLDKPENTSARYGKFVSPNSEFILIYSGKELLVLDKNGTIIDRIKNFYAYLDHNCNVNKFCGDHIQWNKDSKSFYVKKFKTYGKSNNLTEIFKYSIDNKKLKLLTTVLMHDSEFYPSMDERNIYFSFVKSGEFEFKKLNIESGQIIHVKDFNQEKDSIFINFPVGAHTLNMNVNKTHSYKDSKIKMMCYGDISIKGGLYMKRNDSIFHLINVRDGLLPLKGVQYNLKTYDSFFLPGNRYFILNSVDTKNFTGSIIFDVKNMRARKFKSIDDCYFSLTNKDYINYKLGGYKVIKPDLNTFRENPNKFKNIIEKY